MHQGDVAGPAPMTITHQAAVPACGQRQVFPIARASRIRTHRPPARAEIENVDGLAGCHRFAQHRDTVTADNQFVGQREDACIGIAVVFGPPVVHEGRLFQFGRKSIHQAWRGA